MLKSLSAQFLYLDESIPKIFMTSDIAFQFYSGKFKNRSNH